MSDAAAEVTEAHSGELHEHPGPIAYIKVALFLAAVTGGEVAVYYLSGLKPVLTPVLLVMALVKFSVVALYFMHLKFDTRVFRRLLTGGIILAIIVYSVAMVTLFKYL